MKRDYTIKYLAIALMESGVMTARTIPGAKININNWIKAGRLKLRQRPHTKVNLVNEDEIKEIVKAFSVGGEGTWYAK